MQDLQQQVLAAQTQHIASMDTCTHLLGQQAPRKLIQKPKGRVNQTYNLQQEMNLDDNVPLYNALRVRELFDRAYMQTLIIRLQKAVRNQIPAQMKTRNIQKWTPTEQAELCNKVCVPKIVIWLMLIYTMRLWKYPKAHISHSLQIVGLSLP